MENIAIKEIFVKLSEIGKLHKIFETEIKKCADSQIFIDNALYDVIKKDGKMYNIYMHKFFSNTHYKDNYEKSFAFHSNSDSLIIIAKTFFVSSCNGYMQLSQFVKKELVYIHYLVGMKQIVIIHLDEEVDTNGAN